MSQAEPDFGSEGERVAEAYSSPPFWYLLRGALVFAVSYRGSFRTLIEFFEERLGEHHLEIAIGDGFFLDFVLKRRLRLKKPLPSRLVGVDLSPTMLDGARQKFEGRVPITLERGDAAKLPFDDERFDSVAIVNAIHSVHDPDGVFREAFRVLVPGGTFTLNALLHPRGSFVLRVAAERMNRIGIAKGLLVGTFDQTDVRKRLERAGFLIEVEQVHGNDCELACRKPAAH